MSALPSHLSSALMGSLHAAYAQPTRETPAVQAVRQRAWDYFISRGLPTTHDENWKYTQLRQLETHQFAVAAAAERAAVAGIPDAYNLVFINGHYQAAQSTLPQQAGVSITALRDLERTPEQLAAALDAGANASCRFVALNTALTHDGVLVELSDQVALDRPLQLSFVWRTAEPSLMAHPRVVIRLGRYSKLVMLEHYSAATAGAHFVNAVTTIDLAEGALLEHNRVQQENHASFHIGLIHAEVAAHATFISQQFNLGAAIGRLDINTLLNGRNASVELNGLQFAGGTQHHDTHTRVEHLVPHTRSSEDYRGIADQRGRVVFNGKVRVHEKAIGTDARQSSRNLILAPRAEIDTKPELEIYADDVKCAHGATIGQLDANALFYLRSRGLDEKQARGLLTQAFADAVISRVSLESVRNQLTQAVHERFGANVEVPA